VRHAEILRGQRPGILEPAEQAKFVGLRQRQALARACRPVERANLCCQLPLLRQFVRRQLAEVAASDVDLFDRRRLDIIERRAQTLEGMAVALRGNAVQAGAVHWLEVAVIRQLQMRLEHERAQYFDQPGIIKVSHAEGEQHPIIEQIQLWVEEVVVRLERIPEQSPFRLDLVLTGHPHLYAERLGAWVAQRHAQIEQGALVYIAHQLDVLGRMTAPMGEEQDGKP
jgi:hypothetical protein